MDDSNITKKKKVPKNIKKKVKKIFFKGTRKPFLTEYWGAIVLSDGFNSIHLITL